MSVAGIVVGGLVALMFALDLVPQHPVWRHVGVARCPEIGLAMCGANSRVSWLEALSRSEIVPDQCQRTRITASCCGTRKIDRCGRTGRHIGQSGGHRSQRFDVDHAAVAEQRDPLREPRDRLLAARRPLSASRRIDHQMKRAGVAASCGECVATATHLPLNEPFDCSGKFPRPAAPTRRSASPAAIGEWRSLSGDSKPATAVMCCLTTRSMCSSIEATVRN